MSCLLLAQVVEFAVYAREQMNLKHQAMSERFV